MSGSRKYLALLVSMCVSAQAQTLEQRVDSLLARWNQKGPGTAVLLIRSAKVEYRRGFGLADLVHAVPITPDTQFQLESVTKQFTAMGIMILAERNKLSFDDPLSKFCPEFPAYARSITIRNLLNHTSGLREYDIPGDDPDDPNYFRSFDAPHAPHEYTTTEALQALSREKQVDSPPGHHFAYSNAGYLVLAEIIERASGERYGDFLKNAIFAPLGMKDTLVLDERQQKAARLALGYTKTATGWRDVSYFPTMYVYGFRGVISTINDLYEWDQALYTNRLVSHSAIDLAFTPARATDGRELIDPDLTKMMKRPISYGSGWDISSLDGDKLVEHTGRGIGYSAYIIRMPGREITVIMLSNFVNPDRFETARQMIELARAK